MNDKKEVLDIIFHFNKKEFDAMFQQIPMTFDLFEQCLVKCVEIDAMEHFFKLMDTYPEFAEKYILKIERDTCI